MIPFRLSRVRVLLCDQAVDMRKSYEGLWAMAINYMDRQPLDGDLFVFVGRRRKSLKLLYWDGTGTWVMAKRLAKGLFYAPWQDQHQPCTDIGAVALGVLLEGGERLQRLVRSPESWNKET